MSYTTRRPLQMPHFTPNPMDKATIISIIPKDIEENKYTLNPSRFHVKAGSIEAPSLTLVTPAVWYKEDTNMGSYLAIPVGACDLARSIVDDYCNGLIACNMANAKPGIFWIAGAISKISEVPADQLKTAAEQQKNWYMALVKMADVAWARSNGNPIVISDDMKVAAKSLHYEDKPWLRDFQMAKMVSCPACGTLRNDSFPVCGNCHTVVDKAKYDSLKLSRAS